MVSDSRSAHTYELYLLRTPSHERTCRFRACRISSCSLPCDDNRSHYVKNINIKKYAWSMAIDWKISGNTLGEIAAWRRCVKLQLTTSSFCRDVTCFHASRSLAIYLLTPIIISPNLFFSGRRNIRLSTNNKI